MMQCDPEDIERLERIEEVLQDLDDYARAGAILIVEGRKDADSLRGLGIRGEIRLAAQQPLLDLSESLSNSKREIVLLTDWDQKGELISKKLMKHLSVYGITPKTDIRSKLRSLSKKRIKDIESLNNYVNKLRYEVHGVVKF